MISGNQLRGIHIEAQSIKSDRIRPCYKTKIHGNEQQEYHIGRDACHMDLK